MLDKEWNSAEQEFRYALGYSFQDKETMFRRLRVVLLGNLGICLLNQQKKDDAKECWRDALGIFSGLATSISGYEEAAAAASKVRELQTQFGL